MTLSPRSGSPKIFSGLLRGQMDLGGVGMTQEGSEEVRTSRLDSKAKIKWDYRGSSGSNK